MANVNNEELVSKAAITTDAIASSGKLNPAQSDKFIDYVIDESVLKDNARVVRFRNESLDIDKIGVGKRVAMPKSEAADPQRRNGVSTSKITLTPSELMVPFEISDNFRELNLEGDSIEDTIIRLMATALSNDLEDLYINGNKLGPSTLESDYIGEGGSTTQYVKDSYLALQDGWLKLATSGHVVDAAGANIGLSIFGAAIRAMPTKFRKNIRALRWYLSPNLWQLFQEKLSTRATALGDQAAQGNGLIGPFGIPAVPVPLLAEKPLIVQHVVLTNGSPVTLACSPVSDVVVTPSTLARQATTPYVLTTDYTLTESTGVIQNSGTGAITSGATVKVTYRANPQIVLTHQNNMVIGIGRDIRIEKDRDIYKTMNQYAITAKVSVNFEESDAIVCVRNIGLGI